MDANRGRPLITDDESIRLIAYGAGSAVGPSSTASPWARLATRFAALLRWIGVLAVGRHRVIGL